MKYLFILIILFLIECEYNYRINVFDLKDLDRFNEKIEFVAQKNPDFDFHKASFKWKRTNPRNLFPKYKSIKYKRKLFLQHCFRIFGEEKLVDLIRENKSNLVKKYGNTIQEDIEVFEILINYFEIHKFKKLKN